MNSIDRNIRKRTIIKCTKCGKVLLHKLSDGTLEFVFGRSKETEIQTGAPIRMEIKGSVRMKCLRKSCNNWNEINGF